jgi:hypothetical protein
MDRPGVAGQDVAVSGSVRALFRRPFVQNGPVFVLGRGWW